MAWQEFTELPQGAKDILAGSGILQDLDWTGEAAPAADTYLQRTSPRYNVENAGTATPLHTVCSARCRKTECSVRVWWSLDPGMQGGQHGNAASTPLWSYMTNEAKNPWSAPPQAMCKW